MTKYVLRRLVQSLLVLAMILTTVFLAGRVIGNPAQLILGPEGRPEDVATLAEQLGYNLPIFDQYREFVKGWVTGDFGNSWWQNRDAMELAFARVGPTLYLAAASLLIAIPVGLLMGAVGAWRPGSWIDKATNGVSLFGASTVDFWVGLMLIYIVAVQFRLLPTSGMDSAGSVILPALALALRPLGRIAQVTRSSMSGVLSQPYIKAARAKGLREGRIIRVYGLKNASIPILTLSGDELVAYLNGAVVIETVFAWPGIGSLVVSAVLNRDLPLIEASVLVIAVMIILANLIVDLGYTRLDPKIRYG